MPPTVTPPAPTQPAPVHAPAPAPHRSSWHRALFYALAATLMGMMMGALALWFFQKPTVAVVKPPAVHKHAPAKKAVVKPAPAAPTPQVGTPTPAERGVGAVVPAVVPAITIYNCNGTCTTTSSDSAPATTSHTPPSVQPPATSICSEADNYYCGTPPPAAAPRSAPAEIQAPSTFAPNPTRVRPASSGNSINFNLFVNGGGWYSGARYGGYGSTYGWTPGHEELRFDPRTGIYYRVWVAHPHPGY